MNVLTQPAAFASAILLGLLMLLGTLAIHQRRYGCRRCTAEDFLTAGRSVGFWHVSTSVVATWVWAATIMVSARVGYVYGISGPVWYAAGATFQLALFAVLALRIRTKMPLAYTFLEFIKIRFDPRAHKVAIGYSLATSLLVTILVVLGGSRALSYLAGADPYVAAIVVILCFTSYTMVGGLWASIYTDLVQTTGICVGLVILSLYLYSRVDLSAVQSGLAAALPGSQGLMVSSTPALVFGLINAFSMTSTVFVDQAYWGRAICARDAQTAYWGFIAGAVGWYPVPLVAGIFLGALGLGAGIHVTDLDAAATETAASIGGAVGASLFLLVLFMAIISTGDSESSAVGSVVGIDVYRTYLDPGASDTAVITASRLSIVLFGASALAGCWLLTYVGASLWWLFCFCGILVGPAVVPVVLAYLWERGSSSAFAKAPLAGTVAGVAVWILVGIVSSAPSGHGLDTPDALMWGNLTAYAVSTAYYVIGSLLSPSDFSFSSIKPGLPLYAQDAVRE